MAAADRWRALFSGTGALIIALSLSVPSTHAQGTQLRFLGIDMHGGAVFPQDADVGTAFGTRVGLGTLFSADLRFGLGLEWWAADHENDAIEIRDVVAHIDTWTEFGSGLRLRPYLGAAFALHSIDASLKTDTASVGSPVTKARQLDGYRPGADLFGGLAFQVTDTGAIWVFLEYGYSLVADVSNHAVRGGARLDAAGM